MKKEQIITISYLLVSVGLFALAIELWICGAEPYCRENNRLASSVANATVDINVPASFTDSKGRNWSGSAEPRFDVNLTGSSSSFTTPITLRSDGDGDGGDGH